MVGIVPDLTPPNKGFPHTTEREMTEGVRAEFDAVLRRKGEGDPGCRVVSESSASSTSSRCSARGRGAARSPGCPESVCRWKRPPELQNHGEPPKDVIERLFREHGRSFRPILAATEVLRGADYVRLKKDCPQCFAPFVEWLESAGL